MQEAGPPSAIRAGHAGVELTDSPKSSMRKPRSRSGPAGEGVACIRPARVPVSVVSPPTSFQGATAKLIPNAVPESGSPGLRKSSTSAWLYSARYTAPRLSSGVSALRIHAAMVILSMMSPFPEGCSTSHDGTRRCRSGDRGGPYYLP
jgi:hypothetical protein